MKSLEIKSGLRSLVSCFDCRKSLNDGKERTDKKKLSSLLLLSLLLPLLLLLLLTFICFFSGRVRYCDTGERFYFII